MKSYGLLVPSTLLALWIVTADAAPPNFSICDGQAGVALGLCRGGVAAGCDGANGGTEACLAVESNYRHVSSGSAPPWVQVGYPINTISVQMWVGLDLESGVAGYQMGVKYAEPVFPYCGEPGELGSCDAIDLTNDAWEEPAGDSGNPFLFLQEPCESLGEPGYGGVPEYAVLRGVPFANVNAAAIDSATFSPATYQGHWGALPHLGSGDTLIVRTCANNYFKIGNQTCNYPDSSSFEWPACKDPNLAEYWTRFDFQMLRPAL